MTTFARAQSAGSFMVTAGAAWINFPWSHSQEIRSSSAFGTFDSAGTDAQVHNTFAVHLPLTYFITDHIAAEAVLGIPPTLHLAAQGNMAPFGSGGPALPLGTLQPVASARVWAPMLLAKYYFGSPESVIRPYVGAGINYTWFTNVDLHPTLAGALGQVAGPGGSVHASLSSSWNPVVTLGATYNFAKQWSLTGSVTYLPVKTTASFNSVAQNGSVVLENKTRITADPIAFFIGVGHRF
ncbi:OmpW family protein [Cupriavidus pinatubonensis]|nr:OmpW family protein [Cupriavidus pinatubonensis]